MLFILIRKWEKFDNFVVIADEINKCFSNFEDIFLCVSYFNLHYQKPNIWEPFFNLFIKC